MVQVEFFKSDAFYDEERINRLEEIEEEYRRAIEQVRLHYFAKFSSDASMTQEQHLQQV